ncbi:MAG: hypothetical protein GW867_31350 [Armatimonadetes bacterium]|nr:hypothetical protein [Armatimonadota bacterium]
MLEPRRSSLGRDGQKAQALIFYMVAAVAAFAFVGLSLDGSNLYRQRRLMQNAADSGAMAGARTLVGGEAITNADVLAAIQSYATQCGGQNTQVEAYYGNSEGQLGAISDYSSGAAPPVEASGIHVIARTTVTVMFGFVLGQTQKTAGAEAYASFCPATSVVADSGIFPIALEDDTLLATSVGDVIEIWDDNKIVDSLGNEIGGQRGWLNLAFIYAQGDTSRATGKNHSNAALKDWVENGMTPPVTITAGAVDGLDGDFINGDSGTRASAVAKSASRIGQRIMIPIFDRMYSTSEMDAAFPGQSHSFWANNNYYHIVGFAEFEITEVKSTGNPKWIKGRLLTPSVVDGSSSGSGSTFQSDESPSVVNISDGFACGVPAVSTDTTPPAAPSGLATTPASPGGSMNPAITGTAEAGSTVKVRTGSCSGTVVASGTAADFPSSGISASVGAGSTTTFYVSATDAAGNESPCSTIVYTQFSSTPPPDTTPPASPSGLSTTPATPGTSRSPKIAGTAEAGSTVKIRTGSCSGSVVASSSAASFASPGVTVSVSNKSTTTFYVSATDAAGNESLCSTIVYTHVTH